MSEGSKLWYCDCGWKYRSPIPLKHAPSHTCNPRSRTRRTLKQQPTPTHEQEV